MKSKRLLLLLLIALIAPWVANAQSVQIGDGTTTNSYLPSYSLYNYSVTQQIYTAEEIDASGNITSIAFYNAGSEKARKYNIYMAHTTKSAFESTTDWIALTDADMVYQGAEAVALVANEWTTFTFDTPFAYNGTDNLVIGVLDLTGSWSSGMSCRAFAAADQALYKYQDAGAYGIDGTYNGTVQTGSIAATKSQIILGGIQQAHPAPTGLTATPHPTTADLSWTENGTATQWEVAYKTSAEEEFTTVVVNTNPYTLTGLTGETAYNAKVRAYYSETIQSGWSAVANFTTQPTCPAPTGLASSNLTTTSATLTWTAGYEESDWVLQYGTTYAFTENTYTEVTVNDRSTYELSGLADATTYYARVKADCGGDSQSAWSTVLTFTTKEICPEGKICIGDGTATSSYLPANNYYNYSLTQQIYTAAEIGEAGAILSIDFFKAATTAMVKDLDIYMVSTTKGEFESTTDFIPVTASNLVFSGTVTFADNAWTTIELDVPFVYDGQSNVAIMVDNNTGGYVSSTPFYVFNSDKNQALYAQSDGTNFDPFAPSFSSRTAQKNRIRLAIGEPPACPKPTGLTVNYTGGTEATISWTSDAEAWNMRVNGTEINGTITNPYTLTGLELATTYEVEVQANCGDATSDWAGPVSFTTDACMPEDMTIVNYELTDSYGDGWNDNAILVVDESCNIVDQLTIASGSSASGTLKVCGSYVQFLWYKGSYPTETSWVFTDNAGNVLFEGAGNANMATLDVLYTIDNNPYSAPTDVAASEVGPRSAKLSWTETGTATAWQILLTAGDDEEGTIIDANSNPFVLTGLATETEYYAQVRATGANGTSIWTCIGADFTTTEACPLPTEIVVSGVNANSALVSWLGFGESYDLRYAVNPAPIVRRSNGTRSINNNGNYTSKKMVRGTTFASTNDKAATVSVTGINHDRDGWYHYDNGVWENGSIGTGGGNFWWGIMIPAGTYTETNLAKTAVYDYLPMTGNVTIYNDGETAPAGEALAQADVTLTGSGQFVETNFGEVTIDPSKNLWIIYYNGSGATYPAAYCTAQNDANGRWVSTDGTDWSDVSTAVEGCGDFMVRAYLGTITYAWIDVNGITDSEYQLTGLDPETSYIVQIRSNCGDDGQTDYTDGNTFTTMSACDAPNELEAEVTATSATLSWTGAQESYNLRWWRPTSEIEGAFNVADFTQVGEDYTAESELTTYTIDLSAFSGVGNVAIRHYNITDMFRLNVDDIIVTNAQGQVVASEDFESGAINPNWLNEDVDGDGFVWDIWNITSLDANNNPVGNGSYCATSASYNSYGALTPDNWLIIPNVELGGALTFVARGQDPSWSGEVFGVFVSTTQLVVPATEPVVVENVTSPYELTGLDPETEYLFQVQGVNSSCDELAWSEIQNFTTTELTTITQTLALEAGANWVSFNVETTLNDLKAALLEATEGVQAITIQGQNSNIKYNPNNHRWTGQLNALDMSKMYKISVEAACEITLEGMPVDPTALPISIENGSNWIAYPLRESMSVANAFAGFAVNGDKVQSQNSNANYNNGRWTGRLTTLEPGQGYIYQSGVSESRTLVFPSVSGNKK